jgi:hypothetical protein
MPDNEDHLRELARLALSKNQSVAVQAAARKVSAGKPLTRREETLLTAASLAVEASPGNFAKTWDELADACRVDRRTLTNARKSLGSACPKPRADGRHPIAEWLVFLDKAGVKGRGENNPDVSFLDERTLRLEERQLRVLRERLLLKKEEESLLSVADFETALGVMLGQFRATLNAMPGRGAGKIVLRARAAVLQMLKAALTPKTYTRVEALIAKAPIDYADIEEILQDETDIILRTLEACDYMKAGES